MVCFIVNTLYKGDDDDMICLILAKEQYTKRHDSVCAQLHFNICKEIGVKSDN